MVARALGNEETEYVVVENAGVLPILGSVIYCSANDNFTKLFII